MAGKNKKQSQKPTGLAPQERGPMASLKVKKQKKTSRGK